MLALTTASAEDARIIMARSAAVADPDDLWLARLCDVAEKAGRDFVFLVEDDHQPLSEREKNRLCAFPVEPRECVPPPPGMPSECIVVTAKIADVRSHLRAKARR